MNTLRNKQLKDRLYYTRLAIFALRICVLMIYNIMSHLTFFIQSAYFEHFHSIRKKF